DRPLVSTPESRLWFTESFVYAYLGDTEKAEHAQRQALARYPASYSHGPVEIELLRALCLVRAGDSIGGVRQAQTVLRGLAAVDRLRPVVDLGHKVLDAVPITDREHTAVADLRACLIHSGQG